MLLKILHTHDSNNLSTDFLPVDDCISVHVLDTETVQNNSVATQGLNDLKYNQSSIPTESSAVTNCTY
jgi:hypothetical protein